MFTVVITEKSGTQKRLTFGEPEVTIGRVPGNDIVLPKGNVSKRHSRIVLKDNRFIVVDLKSTNGTFVNGRKITSPLVVKEGDKIYIGDFVLTLESDNSASGSLRPPPSRQDLALGGLAPGSGHSAVPPLPSRAPDPMLDAGDDGMPVALRPAALPSGIASYTSVPPPASVMPKAGRSAPSLPPVLGGGLDTVSERPPADGLEMPSTPQEGVMADGVVGVVASPRLEPTSQRPPPGPISAAHALPSRSRHTPASSALPMQGQSDLKLLMLRLSRELDLEDADPNSLSDERRWQKAERAIHAKLTELASEQPARFRDRAGLSRAALLEVVGLGPIDALLSDPQVFQVVVERFDRVRADRGQGLNLESLSFSSAQAVVTVLRRLSAQAGHTGPLPDSLELTLPNGLYVVAVLKAAASDGPVLSVQRRPSQVKSLVELAQAGLLTASQAQAIEEAVQNKRHVWFVGPAGNELSHLMSAALHACPSEERIALFERCPEVATGERSTIAVRLGSVGIDTLLERVRTFRPQRFAIHEPRESDLAPLLGKLAVHHDGAVVSYEERSGKDALIAFERAAGADVVLKSVSLLVELKRTSTGVQVGGIFEPAIDGSGLLTMLG